MDENALAIKLKIDESGKKFYVKEILDNATLSAKQLNIALQDIGAKIKARAAAGGFDLTKELAESEKAFLQVAGALESKVRGVSDGSGIMAKVFAVNIGKTKKKINELSAALEDLTRKQNFNVKKISETEYAPKGLGKNFEKTKAQIETVNKELIATKNHLGQLTAGLHSVWRAGDQAASSVASISTPAQQMVEAWKRGAAYVERYNASLGVANGRILTLVKSSLSLIALHSATRFVRNIREVTSEFEMQRVALGGIIQDTERAEKLFQQIKAAAIQSPFEIKDLVSFTKQLSAYRIETDKLFDVTMKLADVSAGLGVDMNRLVLAYGQVRAASVLRGQELRQFTEAGIPLVELLADKFSELNNRLVSTGEVFELISKRAVPFRMIEEIFDDMTNAGGIFYKMQEKQAETLKGQWMKLRDALSIMYDEIGNTSVVHGAMESLLKDAMGLLQNWRDVAKNVKIGVAAFIAYKVAIANARVAQTALTAAEMAEVSALQLNVVGRSKLIASLFGEAAATKTQIALGNLYVKVKTREMMATNLFSRALYKMTAALLANPYAIAIAGVTALIALLIRLSKKQQEAKISNDELKKSLASFNKSDSHIDDVSKLCDLYDELAKKADRTRDEEEKLARTTKELAKAYPSAVSGAKDHANAIEIDTAAIRERNKEVREAIRLSLKQDKLGAEKTMESYQNDFNRISQILEQGGIRMQTGYTAWIQPITEEEKAAYGKRLIELQSLMKDLGETISESDSALRNFTDDLIGPLPPTFLGDAWRTKMESYAVLLDGATEATRAFTTDQIKNFKSSEDAVDAAVKEYETLAETVDFYTKALQTVTGAQRAQLESQLDTATKLRDLNAQIITDYNAWDKVKDKNKGGRTSYQQDPFINLMQDRIKFMQDFKKGYDDLNKHMSANEALFKEGGIMAARGLSLGINPKEQARAANDLSKWYSDAIDKAFAEAKKHGARGNSVQEFLSQQIKDTSNKGKALRDFQKLIQSLWDAKTDFDTSKLKKDLEDAFKRLTEDIKRSETVRNFYQNILDLTGDQDLAATMSVSVYGGIGNDFKENLQRQLNSALMSLDPSKINDTLINAFNSMDFDTILRNIDKFSEDQQKTLRELASQYEKYNADIAVDLIKSLQSAKTYSEKRVELAMQTAKRLEQINKLNVPEETKAQLRKQNVKKEAEETAKLQYEAFKDSPMYVELFANLDRASSTMLRNMRDNLISMKSAWKDLPATDLKEMQSRIDELNSQLATKNPFRELIASITAYRELTKKQSRQEADATAAALSERANLEKELLDIATEDWKIAKEKYGINSEEELLARDNMEVQKEETDLAEEEAKAAQETANAYREIAQWIQDGAEGLQKWAGYVNDAVGNVNEIVSAFASDDFAETFKILSDGLTRTLSGAAKIGAGLSKGLAGIPDIISGITDIVVGIGLAIQGINIKEINKQIKEQQEKIDALERSYNRLDKAMAKAFGSDYIYNYNKQLDALQAKIDAYNEQARLEESKGKKTDADKVKEYREAAEDAAEQIADMQGQLAEYFAGTDLTSAAKDFANSWIEAYKEFGSTTSAMKEKFQDMIQSMVEQSLGAKIMQTILKPLFDSIDAMAASGGELSAQEIAQIAQSAPEYIDQINNAMTNLMNQLSAAGYNVRQGVGQFTGISRDIANASEESINGLAAGINTQNFYMSLISQNVAAILAVMTGSADVNGTAGAASPEDPYKKSMLEFVGVLPEMHDDMHEVRRLLTLVVRPNGTTSTHYVATRS